MSLLLVCTLIIIIVISYNVFYKQSSSFSLDQESFSFTWLLHTYFSVPDISKVTISGLGGLTYVDKVGQIHVRTCSLILQLYMYIQFQSCFGIKLSIIAIHIKSANL